MDPETMQQVPADGETMGEIMFRGNITMKGYLKNAKATTEAFAGGWFHSGDLAVLQPDGYVKIKDRSKDIIISGGENISSLEVEDALYRHPAVLAAAVVAQPDPKWGESPCAFVELQARARARPSSEIIEHCRERLAHFKAPQARGVRRAAQDLDRQDPEVPAARTREVGLRNRMKSCGSAAACAVVEAQQQLPRSGADRRRRGVPAAEARPAVNVRVRILRVSARRACPSCRARGDRRSGNSSRSYRRPAVRGT